MKFTLVRSLYKGIERVIRRFPAAMLVCLAGTVLGIVSIHIDDSERLVNSILPLTLAAPLFVATVLFSEARKLSVKQSLLIHGSFGVALIGYFFLLPEPVDGFAVPYIRHVMWALGFILVLTFIPFVLQWGKETIQRFWQFNRGLVFTFLLTLFWVWAIQMGLSVALMAVDVLFDIGLNPDRFMEIWIVLVGLFAPLFFLHRLPENPHTVKVVDAYPKEVRLFSTFVLVPLVTIYFLILYAYTVRILVSFDWPSGQLAWMILGFSFVGVLAYVALYPLRETQKWVRYFGSGLFMAMIPQTGMLFWSLSFRLRDYGVTENRYFVLIFGFWLMAMAIYYLVSRAKDIRLIPATLFTIAVLTSFGPWGAFEVSEHSQVDRLQTILERNGLLVEGVYTRPSEEGISDEDEIEINEIVRYLSSRHSFDLVESWFEGQDLDAMVKESGRAEEEIVIDVFGLNVHYPNQTDPWGIEPRTFQAFIDPPNSSPVEIGEGQYLIDVLTENGKDTFEIEGAQYDVALTSDQKGMVISRDGEMFVTMDFSFLMDQTNRPPMPREDGLVFGETQEASVLFSIEDFFGEFKQDRVEVFQLQGLLLVTFR